MPERGHADPNAARVAPPLPRTRRLLLSGLLACAAAASVGCRGQASVYFTPMDFKRITTNRPLMCHFKPNECYYWINDDGKLCIAMQRRSGRLLGNWLRRAFLLSTVLGAPPTAPARPFVGHPPTPPARTHPARHRGGQEVRRYKSPLQIDARPAAFGTRAILYIGAAGRSIPNRSRAARS